MEAQLKSDKFAISLSLACVVHCFFVPSFVILSSGIFATAIDNEFVHNLILFFAIPISLLALILGYKKSWTGFIFPYWFTRFDDSMWGGLYWRTAIRRNRRKIIYFGRVNICSVCSL